MLTEALLVLFLLLFLYLANKRPSGLPPGLWGWPVLGRLPSTAVSLGDQVTNLRPIYGDIITWRIGSRIFVFLCNFSLIKTALSKLEFAEKPDFFVYNAFKEVIVSGTSPSNEIAWHHNRKFVQRQLRALGTGKSGLEAAIHYEATCLVEDLRKHTDQPQPLPPSYSVAVLNIIWKIVADHRFDLSDHQAHQHIRAIISAVESMQGTVNLFNVFPWLERVAPHFLKKRMGCVELVDSIRHIHSYATTLIEDHLASLDPAHPRDLLDAYLIEMRERKQDPNSTLNMQELRLTIADLLVVGTETISTTMRWAILYLAKHPQAQARIQQEIDAAVPRGTLPSLQHKDKLAYLQAVINETLRLVSIAPLTVAHSAVQDTQLGGYTIPKGGDYLQGTVVTAHLEGCHMDPSYWEKPHQFYPEHFLDQQGRFVTKKEGFLPFSVGRRACLGEALARAEMFLLLSAMLQNFSFTAPAGEELSTEKDPLGLMVHLPKPYNVVISERR